MSQPVARFNLVDEPWIPCVPITGGEPVLLSLRDTLVGAAHYREILDDSPLVVVALHRLLFAVLHRVLRGPRTPEEWKALYGSGHFDAGVIDRYLTSWRHRFDLFDPEMPFYQVPVLAGTSPVSVASLAHELASGNNITLFDHTVETSAAFTPAQAVRYLLAFQSFAFAGGKSEPFYFSDSPLTRDFTVLVRGETTFETLMLNLVLYDKERPIPWLDDDDLPCWERAEVKGPVKEGTPPSGYLDYLTWQSRRVHLEHDRATGMIRKCQIRQNFLCAMGQFDPFKAYHKTKDGWLAGQLDEERAVWRDSQALLEASADAETGSIARPRVIEHLAQVEGTGLGRDRRLRQRQLDVLGIASRPGKQIILLWRHERLPLPLIYLNNSKIRGMLARALDLAERVSKLFKPGFFKGDPSAGKKGYPRPMRVLADELLTATASRKADGGDVERLVKHLGAERDYWARLDAPFRRFMVTLAERMEAEGREGGEAAYLNWAEDVAACARRAFRAAIDSLDTSGRSLRAQALAEREFNWQLRAMLPHRELVLEEAQV